MLGVDELGVGRDDTFHRRSGVRICRMPNRCVDGEPARRKRKVHSCSPGDGTRPDQYGSERLPHRAISRRAGLAPGLRAAGGAGLTSSVAIPGDSDPLLLRAAWTLELAPGFGVGGQQNLPLGARRLPTASHLRWRWTSARVAPWSRRSMTRRRGIIPVVTSPATSPTTRSSVQRSAGGTQPVSPYAQSPNARTPSPRPGDRG
jgi:hypothetical protein